MRIETSHTVFFLRFFYKLSADMLRSQLQKQSPVRVEADLFFNILLILRELMAQFRCDINYPVHITHDPDPAEHDHALDIQRPLARFGISFIMNAERNLIITLQRIQPVTDVPAVKIYPAILFVVPVIHGHSVRITVVTVY